MDLSKHEQTVAELTKKAKVAEKSEDAMRFSQSALNCAHAFQVIAFIQKEAEKTD